MSPVSRNTQKAAGSHPTVPRIFFGNTMPNKRNNKSKKQGRKPKGGPRSSAPFTLRVAPPSQAIYRFVYAENVGLTSSDTATPASHTMSLNNLYDPNISGTGYQPIGFDQMSALWLNYRVLSVRVRLEVFPASATGTVGFYPSGLSSLPADWNAWTVQPFARTVTTSTTMPRRLSAKIVPWNVLGVTKANYMSENDYLSSATGGPLRPVYLQLFAKTSGAATSASTRIYIEYTVLASQPVALGMS